MATPRQARPPLAEDPSPDDPLVGARLRYGLVYVQARVLAALAAAGFGDIQIAHFQVLRFPPPANTRPIDLADRAGSTKQAMNYLLLQLEEMGYVRRVGRARGVSLTKRGAVVARLQRATVRRVEREWEERVGARRFRTFYEVLRALTDR